MPERLYAKLSFSGYAIVTIAALVLIYLAARG
jgi:hypothetical protein